MHTLTPVVKTFTQDKVVEMLRKKQGNRSLRALARELGISPAYLSDIYKGRRNPGPAILDGFGLHKKVTISTQYEQSQ
jgi:transcriptional regulator with XRE-family HTH domain